MSAWWWRFWLVLVLQAGWWPRVSGAPWDEMDYGPFLTASIQAPGPATNIAYKGIAVNLGRAAGSASNEAIVFDTDLLRYAFAWTGGFVALKGVVYDGEHWAYPRAEGEAVYVNPAGPGWASPAGAFDDPRPRPYGPLPRAWAKWRGLHLHGNRGILSYTVGDMPVLEEPGLERRDGLTAWVRSIDRGRSSTSQVLQVFQEAGGTARLESLDTPGAVVGPDMPARDVMVVLGVPGGGEVLAVALRGGSGRAVWRVDAGGHVRLAWNGPSDGEHLKLITWRGGASELPRFRRLVREAAPAESLERWVGGGPPRWPERLVTRGTASPAGTAGLAVEELVLPEDNPWKSWMRPGGLAFFPGGERAAITTWNGDVWVVDGVGGDLRELGWRRFATGLFQPLGVLVDGGTVLALGRDQITRLHDLNGDGEADFYENFNNDCEVSEHFHEFAIDLKRGWDGAFYYVKCARHALPAVHAHHGTLLRVSEDGSTLSVVARGFRAVNGLGVSPCGEFTTIDNQGHWMPANRLNWVVPGGWYGNQWAWNPDNRTDYDPPLCWMHNFVDRSGGTQLWVPERSWPELAGQLITVSYGMGHLFVVLRDETSAPPQGAVTRLPLDFETGVMRGVFHPHNGQLYVAGLYGWAGNKTRAGGFYRIRRTEAPLCVPNRLRIASDGIELGFTAPLDPSAAMDPGNYDLKAWNYRWSAQYGSPDLKADGTEGRDTWTIESVGVSSDGRTVYLRVPGIRPVMQWHLVYNLRGGDGAPLANFVHGTIHRAGLEPLPQVAQAQVAAVAKHRMEQEAPGLRLEVTGVGGAKDVRRVRLPSLFVPEGGRPSALVPPGPFRARWEGFVRMEVNERVAFECEGVGAVSVTMNHAEVLNTVSMATGARAEADLRGGLNHLVIEYQSPPSGAAEFRLVWASARMPREPVPSTVCVHDAAEPELVRWGKVRRGMEIVGERQCTACHAIRGLDRGVIPDWEVRGASLDGVGAALREEWLRRWILDPKALRHDARMPQVLAHLGVDDAARDAQDLAAFLAQGAATREAEAPVDAAAAAAGEALYQRLGCAACHSLPADPWARGDSPISLADVRLKYQPGALAAFLRDPARRHRWTRMPDFGLTQDEARVLEAYLVREAREPGGPGAGGGDPGRGRRLIVEHGCVNCHAMEGVEGRAGPEIDLAARGPRRGCLAVTAEARVRAPGFGWWLEEYQDLLAFLSERLSPERVGDTPSELAERQLGALRCQACHGRDGMPDVWSGLKLADAGGVDDEEGAVAGSVHLGRPILTHTGEKLHSEWVRRLLEGSLPYKARPEAQGRMPRFSGYAAGLAEGLAHQHGYAASDAPVVAVDAALAETGRRLTLVEGGFSCVSCHGVGGQRALAGEDTATVNFGVVGDRLRGSYYWRYVQDPPRVAPGTMMPKFIGDDGRTAIRGVFDGDPARQFEAIWHYLHSIRGRDVPGH